jgi:hypothetical protein
LVDRRFTIVHRPGRVTFAVTVTGDGKSLNFVAARRFDMVEANVVNVGLHLFAEVLGGKLGVGRALAPLWKTRRSRICVWCRSRGYGFLCSGSLPFGGLAFSGRLGSARHGLCKWRKREK